MKKLAFLIVALCVGVFAPSKVQAEAVVCERSTDTLDIAGEIEFTSRFCDCEDGDYITIEIIPTDGSVTIGHEKPPPAPDYVDSTKATPQKATNDIWAEQTGGDDYTATVRLHKVTDRAHVILLWVYLSTGEHIGVNAQFSP